jgi:hypothetical protein
LQPSMHALAPPQPITQLSKLLHWLVVVHMESCVQQWALAHVSHCDADAPALHMLEPPSPPDTATEVVGLSAQLASPAPLQSPMAGGRSSDEHAPRTTSAASAREIEGRARIREGRSYRQGFVAGQPAPFGASPQQTATHAVAVRVFVSDVTTTAGCCLMIKPPNLRECERQGLPLPIQKAADLRPAPAYGRQAGHPFRLPRSSYLPDVAIATERGRQRRLAQRSAGLRL